MKLLGKSKMLAALKGEDSWDLPTSMIDVVFLLLIFFMCTSRFSVLEERMDAMLPAEGTDPTDEIIPFVPELTVRVSAADPSMLVARYQINRWVTHDPNELAARLARLVRVNKDGKVRVRIDGQADCPFRHVMSAMDASVRAGIKDVSFAPPPVAAEDT